MSGSTTVGKLSSSNVGFTLITIENESVVESRVSAVRIEIAECDRVRPSK
jgi:hypothetical protein